jgi:uncharacterized membrane protein YbhN (UPF0104 family)
LLKLLKKEKFKTTISKKNSFIIFFLTFINFLLLGLGYYFVILSVSSINIFYCIAIFALSNSISIINFFIPLGLGLKEAIILFMLKPYISIPTILIVIILTRIWTSIGKLSLILIQFIFDKIQNLKFSKKF